MLTTEEIANNVGLVVGVSIACILIPTLVAIIGMIIFVVIFRRYRKESKWTLSRYVVFVVIILILELHCD